MNAHQSGCGCGGYRSHHDDATVEAGTASPVAETSEPSPRTPAKPARVNVGGTTSPTDTGSPATAQQVAGKARHGSCCG